MKSKAILARALTTALVLAMALSLVTSVQAAKEKFITILLETVPDSEYVIRLIPEFEKATGIKVNVEKTTFMVMRDKLMTNVLSGRGQYDVIVVGAPFWTGQFVNGRWIIPLDDYIKETPVHQRKRFAYTALGFLVPSLVILGVAVLVPLLYVIYLSFTDYSFIAPTQSQFVGIRNYIDALWQRDFRNSLWVTTIFTVVTVGLETVLGLIVALALRTRQRYSPNPMLPDGSPPAWLSAAWTGSRTSLSSQAMPSTLPSMPTLQASSYARATSCWPT